MLKASFAKLDDDTWGIRVDGIPPIRVAPGDSVEVTKRDGTTKTVQVVAVRQRFNGGRSAFCTIASKRGPRQPRFTASPPPPPAPSTNGTAPVVSEAIQIVLGELDEALVKDGVGKDAAIIRGIELLRGLLEIVSPTPTPALVDDLTDRAAATAVEERESYLLSLTEMVDHPDADRPPGTSGSWGEK